MAATIASRSARQSWVAGSKKFRVSAVTLDNSYPTGGYAISNAQLGFQAGDTLDFVNAAPAAGYVFEWDYTNKKLKAYRQTAATGALAEVANAVDLSAVSTRVLATGN